MFFDEVTFGTVSSATAEGASVYYFDEQNARHLIQLEAAKFGEIIPEDNISGQWLKTKYQIPDTGSTVAFELEPCEPGASYVTYWTTTAHYAASELEARSSRIRIMQGDTCVWSGKFAMEPDVVHRTEGVVPDVLTDDMDIERDEPDEVVDTAYDTSYLAPGGWLSVQDPPREEVWHRIKHAKVLTT